jgi:hypothetical protein
VIGMAREPDNLVLTLLREMRGDVSEIKSKLGDLSLRFDAIEKKFDDHQYLMTHTFGIAGLANVQTGLVDARVNELAARQKATEAKQAELERRLARVEEKV